MYLLAFFDDEQLSQNQSQNRARGESLSLSLCPSFTGENIVILANFFLMLSAYVQTENFSAKFTSRRSFLQLVRASHA